MQRGKRCDVSFLILLHMQSTTYASAAQLVRQSIVDLKSHLNQLHLTTLYCVILADWVCKFGLMSFFSPSPVQIGT